MNEKAIHKGTDASSLLRRTHIGDGSRNLKLPKALYYGIWVWLGSEFARMTVDWLESTPYSVLHPSLPGTALTVALLVLFGASGRPRIGAALGGVVVTLLLGGAETKGSSNLGLRDAQLLKGVPVTARILACGNWREGEFSVVSSCSMRSYRWQGKVTATDARIRVAFPKGGSSYVGCARVRGLLRRPQASRNKLFGGSPQLGLMLSVKSERLIDVESCGGMRDLWRAASWSVRSKIVDVLLLGPSSAGGPEGRTANSGHRLAAAMWLGDRQLIPTRLQAGLGNWGLAHLLSVSGLHIGILLALGFVMLGAFAARFPTVCAIAQCCWLLTCGMFVLLAVGPRVSVTRALAMAAVALLTFGWKRPSGSLGSIGVALCVMFALSPEAALSLGFKLSFAATVGVVVGGPLLAGAWTCLPRSLATALAVSVSAQLATLPWALTVYPVIPLVAPVVNLLAIPVGMMALLLGLLLLLGDLAGLSLAWALAPFINGCGELFVWLTELEPTPWLQPAWPWHPMLGLVWATGCFLVCMKPLRRWALVPVLAGTLWWPPSATEKVSFLDVGQGDAILLRSGRHSVLVDGGGWRSGQVAKSVLLPVLAKERIRRLDAVVLSHGDLDHCRGLLELTWMIQVDELWLGPGPQSGGCVESLMNRFPMAIRRLQTGDRQRVGNWTIQVLADGTRGQTANGRSLVLVAEQASYAVVLTGDIEARDELTLLLPDRGLAQVAIRRVATIDHVILKVAHHGSRTSSSARFLDAVQPSVAVISTGARNPYGHPSADVLKRMAEKGIEVKRTDFLGRIDYCLPDGCKHE